MKVAVVIVVSLVSPKRILILTFSWRLPARVEIVNVRFDNAGLAQNTSCFEAPRLKQIHCFSFGSDRRAQDLFFLLTLRMEAGPRSQLLFSGVRILKAVCVLHLEYADVQMQSM